MTSYPKLYKIDSKGKIRVYFIEQEEHRYRMVTGVLDGNLVRSKWTEARGKNIGRSNETTPEVQAELESFARYTKKENAGYYNTLDLAKENPEGKFFQPMLATEFDKIKEKDRKFPYIADPKLDGMRMTKTGYESISRRGKAIPTVPHIVTSLIKFHETYDSTRLDGEIYNHEYKEDFNTLMSVARCQKPDINDLKLSAEKLEYHVYDMYDTDRPGLTALERKLLLDIHMSTDYMGVEVVDWELVTNMEELEIVRQRHLLAGYEGTILRSPDEPYYNKRTKHLIKVKEFVTEEFILVDVLDGKGNKSGMAGSIVIDKVKHNGDSIEPGIRGNWDFCKWLLANKTTLIGKQVTVEHFGETPDGSLRFPRLIDINRPD